MPKEIVLVQGTPEWLQWRTYGIGGSDAGAIMGTSPWCDALELWQRKLGLIPEIQSNAAMQRGHDLEPDARLLFEMEYGLAMPAACFEHDEFPYVRASLDGVSIDRNIILEIKCPGSTTHAEALAGKIKPYYYTQMQHQMAVTGAELCYYWSYNPDWQDRTLRTKKIEVPRDEEVIKRLFEREAEFWNCIETKTEPSAARFSAGDAGLLNGDARTDPAFLKALQEILTAKSVLEDAQRQFDLREARINELLQRKKQIIVVSNGVRLERIYNAELDKWNVGVTMEDEID